MLEKNSEINLFERCEVHKIQIHMYVLQIIYLDKLLKFFSASREKLKTLTRAF